MNKLSSNDIARANIRYYRVTKKITQEEMASYLEFDTKHYSHLECGDYNITLQNLDLIATKLEIEPWKLLKENHSLDEVPNRVDIYKSNMKPKETTKNEVNPILNT